MSYIHTYIHTILLDSTGHCHVGTSSVFVLNVAITITTLNRRPIITQSTLPDIITHKTIIASLLVTKQKFHLIISVLTLSQSFHTFTMPSDPSNSFSCKSSDENGKIISSKAQQTTSEISTYIHTILLESTGHWHVCTSSMFVLNVGYQSEKMIHMCNYKTYICICDLEH